MTDLTRLVFAIGFAALTTVTALAQSVVPASEQIWTTYSNARFGVISEVPNIGFFRQDEPANGDGMSLLDESTEIDIRVYGSFWNVLADNFDEYRRTRREYLLATGARITYSPTGENWFVFSGYVADRIFYLKAVTRADCTVAGHLYFNFPANLRDAMSPIIEYMEDSMRVGTSSVCP